MVSQMEENGRIKALLGSWGILYDAEQKWLRTDGQEGEENPHKIRKLKKMIECKWKEIKCDVVYRSEIEVKAQLQLFASSETTREYKGNIQP